MKKFNISGVIISAGIALLTGFISSILSGNPSTVYKSLTLPPYSPPGWLFGVVWPILYILMGIAAYLIFISVSELADKRKALITYAAQLLVNFSWSIIFFRFQEYGLAVVVLALLLLLVTLTIMYFYDLNRLSACLLIPYYLWLIYAFYLNTGVFVLNYNAI
ncbi:MAG: tryptophan-rich sensory protein [Herbinix sp.]|nr:tryptophan-rich sensory protein [Herbinix sp.]